MGLGFLVVSEGVVEQREFAGGVVVQRASHLFKGTCGVEGRVDQVERVYSVLNSC